MYQTFHGALIATLSILAIYGAMSLYAINNSLLLPKDDWTCIVQKATTEEKPQEFQCITYTRHVK